MGLGCFRFAGDGLTGLCRRCPAVEQSLDKKG